MERARTVPSRRFPVMVMALALVAVATAHRAAAETLLRDAYESGFVRCLFTPERGPTVELFVSPGMARIQLVGVGEGETDQASMTSTAASATIPVSTYGGTPLGDASVNLLLTPTGDPIRYRTELPRDGNVVSWTWTTAQLLAVEGTLAFRGATYAVTGCEAVWERTMLWTTNPDAYVLTWTESGPVLACSFELGTTSARLYAVSSGGSAYAELLLDDRYGVASDPVLTARTFDATFELMTWDDQPTGTVAIARASLSPTSSPDITRQGPEIEVVRTSAVSGILSIPGLGDLDLASCTASQMLHYAYIGKTPSAGS